MEFLLILGIIFFGYEKFNKLNRRIRQLEKKIKGGKDMSQLVKNLVNQEARFYFGEAFESAYIWKILAADDDWLEIEREDKKGNRTRKLVRVDDIKSIELD